MAEDVPIFDPSSAGQDKGTPPPQAADPSIPGGFASSLQKAEQQVAAQGVSPGTPPIQLTPESEQVRLRGQEATIQLGGTLKSTESGPKIELLIGGVPATITQISNADLDDLMNDPLSLNGNTKHSVERAQAFMLEVGGYKLLVDFEFLNQKPVNFFNANNKKVINDQLANTAGILDPDESEKLKELETLLDKLVSKGEAASERAKRENAQTEASRKITLDIGRENIQDKERLVITPVIEGAPQYDTTPSVNFYLIGQDEDGAHKIITIDERGIALDLENVDLISGGKHCTVALGADCKISVKDGKPSGESTTNGTFVTVKPASDFRYYPGYAQAVENRQDDELGFPTPPGSTHS